MIRISGARTHNLQNIDLEFPSSRCVVITGLSGSGKSSLAFDTLFAEGQRRYMESLSAYARQFLPIMDKADVDSIEGLSPAISIQQKTTSFNPRSTVGTVTEILDYLRLLYARIGNPCCPTHKQPLVAKSVSQMADTILVLPLETPFMILAPVTSANKGEHQSVFRSLQLKGFLRVRIDGNIFDLDKLPKLSPKVRHDIAVVVDRLRVRQDNRLRIIESLAASLEHAQGVTVIASMDSSFEEFMLSANHACPFCGYSIAKMEPRFFSFNSPVGACPDCEGLGSSWQFDTKKLLRPHLSLLSGAVYSWDRRNIDFCSTVHALARHYRFDAEAPFSSFPENIRQVVLYGSGGEKIDFSALYSRRRIKSSYPFVGLIKSLEKQTESVVGSRAKVMLKHCMSMMICTTCQGARLNRSARNVLVGGCSLHRLTQKSIIQILRFIQNLQLSRQKRDIAERIVSEVTSRLRFLIDVGLGYLTLARSSETLSGGESQRIRLASQIGSRLVGVTYILDEPSIGLHPCDNQKLLDTLFALRDLGNNVIVVEHDEEFMRQADHIVDMGPGAGALGGKVVAQGDVYQISSNQDSLTGDYLSGRKRISVPIQRRLPSVGAKKAEIIIQGACANNLKSLDVHIPLGLLVCVTGVSGSGKSSLVNHTLLPNLLNDPLRSDDSAAVNCKGIGGSELINRVIDINQRPIGRTPRSNPATYTGLFQPVRELFSSAPEARSRGYLPGRFSFNVSGGRCDACQGGGVIKVEMHFLPDVYVQCELCQGKRYNEETLEILYKGKSIIDVLNMSVDQAYDFFKHIPAISSKLATMMRVGLGYITLGHSAVALSGGEAQRVKLSRELAKSDAGSTLYILDEPTTGLHFHDIDHLLSVLLELRRRGNTVVVVEHSLEVVKVADYVIDLGPGGGDAGGELVACGTPEEICLNEASVTGRYLSKVMSASLKADRKVTIV